MAISNFAVRSKDHHSGREQLITCNRVFDGGMTLQLLVRNCGGVHIAYKVFCHHDPNTGLNSLVIYDNDRQTIVAEKEFQR